MHIKTFKQLPQLCENVKDCVVNDVQPCLYGSITLILINIFEI